MDKIKNKKEVLYKTSDEYIKWKDIKDFQFEDDDILNIGWEEPYYSENNSHDGYFYVIITRMIEETVEEYAKRIKEKKEISERLRELRLKQYLKLKKEFETE